MGMEPRDELALAVGGPRPHNARMLDHRFARLRALSFALAIFAPLACKSAGGVAPIEGVRPADEVRPALLATVTVAPLDRIVGDVDGLAHVLGLPFTGKDLLSMLAAQNHLTPEATAQIDTAQPIGLAFVAPKGKEENPMQAMALATRGAGAADKLIAGLGTVAETQKAARKITRSDGTAVWVATRGAQVFVSDSLEGLVAASALALEAQRPPVNDVTVSMFPDAFARWRGTDVRTALAQARKELMDEQITAAQKRGGPVPGPAERLMYESTMDLFLQPLAETAAGAVTLDLDPARGISFGLRLQPRAGSNFARQIAVPTPYVVDPTIFAPGSDGLAGFWALGPSPFWLQVYDNLLAAQAKAGTKGAAEVARHFQAIRPYLNGAGSGALRLQKGALVSDVVVPLKGAAPAGLLDALAALTSSPGFSDFLREIYGGATPALKSRRDKAGLRTELAFPLRDRPGDPGKALQAFFGSPTLAMISTVAGGRLLMATEPAAAGRLDALATGAGAKAPPPELAEALAATKGQDGFMYLDLWSMMKPAVALAAKPEDAQMIGMATSMPGFSQLKLPVVVSHQGGKLLTAEMRIPLSTLTNAANVARPFLGAAAK
jgi:hypothetical protein